MEQQSFKKWFEKMQLISSIWDNQEFQSWTISARSPLVRIRDYLSLNMRDVKDYKKNLQINSYGANHFHQTARKSHHECGGSRPNLGGARSSTPTKYRHHHRGHELRGRWMKVGLKIMAADTEWLPAQRVRSEARGWRGPQGNKGDWHFQAL